MKAKLGSVVTMFIATLLSSQCAQRLTDGQLYIKRSCRWSYLIEDIYSVTMQDVGPACPKGSIASTSANSFVPSNIYQLNMKPRKNGRDVDINWEYSGCHTEFYMEFVAQFKPDFRIDETRRKCVRFTVKRLSNNIAYNEVRLHFNCLRINSMNVGTLMVETHVKSALGTAYCLAETSSNTKKTFNLGCDIDRTKVENITCLTIEFSGLDPHTDYKKTSIVLNGPGKHTSIFSGSDITSMRFSSDLGILYLPVHGKGAYDVEVNLVCNASGEVKEKKFHLKPFVTDVCACPTYIYPCCDIGKVEVKNVGCFTIEFSRLFQLTDFEKTSIIINGPGNCMRAYTESDIIRFNDTGILTLYVQGNGAYQVEVNVVCSASGEVKNETFQLQTFVTNAYSCAEYTSTSHSACAYNKTPRTAPHKNSLYTVITVVSGIGIVALVVIVVFVYRRGKDTHSGQNINANNGGVYELQQLSRNGGNSGNNNTHRDVLETTQLHEEDISRASSDEIK